jgi:pyruvate formate lyase activating enzyme
MGVKGYVNQYETMGTVDGPGTRFVVFLQGCLMRCKYCHNPETIEPRSGADYATDSDKVVQDILALKPYYLNGGVTLSGGEPMLQMDFIIDIAKQLDAQGLSVAIDTSGSTFVPGNKEYLAKVDELIKYTDLFLLDIKHIDCQKHLELTTKTNTNTLAFAEYLSEHNAKMWIRYVLVPDFNDDEKSIRDLGKYIETLNGVENVEILPYHSMAVKKWEKLGWDYQLKGTRDADSNDVKRAYEIMFPELMKKKRLQE